MITVYIILAILFGLSLMLATTKRFNLNDVGTIWVLMMATMLAGFLFRFGMFTFEQAIKWNSISFLWGGMY